MDKLARQHRVLEALRAGKTQEQVARTLGVTKNTIAGLWRDHGEPVQNNNIAPSTIFERLDALHATLDRVLEETRGIGVVVAVTAHPPKGVRL